jgi:hypothetical protein
LLRRRSTARFQVLQPHLEQGVSLLHQVALEAKIPY